MYNSQDVSAKIKQVAKSQKTSVNKMLIDCGLNKNSLYTMQSSGYLPRTETLAKIADYLDCSVDYLLGRSDNPKGILPDAGLSDTEKKIIEMYRNKKNLQQAVKKLLDVD